MLFFDDKTLLKYSGVTGSYLATNCAVVANAAYDDAARVFHNAMDVRRKLYDEQRSISVIFAKLIM